MDSLEQAVAIECLRQLQGMMGFHSAEAFARDIASDQEARHYRAALAALKDTHVRKEDKRWIAEAAIRSLAPEIDAFFLKHGDLSPESRAMLLALCERFGGVSRAGRGSAAAQARVVAGLAPAVADVPAQADLSPADDVADRIMTRWKASPYNGSGRLESGIYQSFRRNKPSVDEEYGAEDEARSADRVVICELIRVDTERMECVLVASTKHVYAGTLSINHQGVLFGSLQRPSEKGSFNQRLLALRTENARLPFYSGLTIKVGSKTERPLASDTLYVRVDPGAHSDLYAAFDRLAATLPQHSANERPFVGETIAQYLSPAPPLAAYDPAAREWERVRFLCDFPGLEGIARPDAEGRVYFREPQRTLSLNKIIGLAKSIKVPVFRQS